LFSTYVIILGFQVSYSLGEIEGYKTYTNNMNGLEIQYPEDWTYKVQSHDPDTPEEIFKEAFTHRLILNLESTLIQDHLMA